MYNFSKSIHTVQEIGNQKPWYYSWYSDHAAGRLTSRLAVGPSQPPIQWVVKELTITVKLKDAHKYFTFAVFFCNVTEKND